MPSWSARSARPPAILGEDLWALAAEGPAEALNRTVVTQPLMLTAGVACWRAWRERGGPMPAFFAGHSLGEYSALVAAGAIRFEDALPLVRLRAQAMQEAVPEGTGGIAAIVGLEDAKVAAICAEAAQGEALEPANLNSPIQIVIAGHRAAVERGMAAAKAQGAKIANMLPMSAPSHCSLMKPAAERLRERLAAVVHRAASRCRWSRMPTWPPSTIPTASARRWSSSSTARCAGSRPSATCRRRASRASSSARPARCSPGS